MVDVNLKNKMRTILKLTVKQKKSVLHNLKYSEFVKLYKLLQTCVEKKSDIFKENLTEPIKNVC